MRASPPAAVDADTARRQDAAAKAAAFEHWITQWRRGEQPAVGRGIDLARARLAALRELIPLDPKAALALAVPRGLRRELTPEILAELETPVDGFGDLDVLAVCFGSRDATLRYATIGERKYEAHVYGRRLSTMTKNRLPLHGIAIGDQFAVDENPYRRLEPGEFASAGEPAAGLVVAVGSDVRTFSSAEALGEWSGRMTAAEAAPGPETANALAPAEIAVAASASWVFGEKTVLFLRAEFPDDPGSPATDQQIADSMTAVNSYYADVSRGRTSFKATVFPGTLRTTATKTAVAESTASGQRLISDDVLQQAREYDSSHGGTGEFNPDRYDRWVVVFKRVSQLTAGITGGTISWSGLASVGGKSIWLNGTVGMGVVAHEIGHNQGLRHSHSWKPSTTSSIQPGTTEEYGDVFDVMGNSGSIPYGHFNTKQKSNILYLDDAETTAATANGTFRIHRSDHRSASGVQALRVAAGSGYDYWIEHRQQVSPSVPVAGSSRVRSGVLLHWGKAPTFAAGSGTFLLDSMPLSSSGMNDAALPLGETFIDPDFGINITPLATGGDVGAEWIDVRVGFGATGNNRNPIFASTPPPAAALAARADITFTAAASDPDGDTVYYRWDFGDGLINPTTPTVQHRWLKGGAYTVNVAALDGKGGFASRSFNVDIADPLVSWTNRADGVTTSWLYAILHAAGKFVATGASGTVLLSPDGINWTRGAASSTSFTLRGLAHDGNRYVGVGSNYSTSPATGAVSWSTDGLTWQTGALPAGAAELNAVAAGAGRFVAVGRAGKIYTSSDAASWAEATSPITTELRAIVFANGRFVGVGTSGRVVTSADGLTWTNQSLATSALFSGVTRAGGTWYAISSFEVWSSSDAATWTKAPASPTLGTNAVLATQAGLLLAGTFDGKIALAENDRAWETIVVNRSETTATTYYGVAEANGLVVAVGSRGAVYSAGTPQFIAPRLSEPAALARLVAGRANLIAAEAAGFAKIELLIDGRAVDETTDASAGLKWTPPRFGTHQLVVRGTTASGATVSSAPVLAKATLADWEWLNPSPVGNDLNSAVRVNGRWWIAGDAGTLFNIDAAGNVATVDLRTNTDFKAITHANGRFVVAGWGYDYSTATGVSALWTSTDGVNWTAWSGGAYLYINQMAQAGGQWVGVGESGRIISSRDGVSWTTQVSGVTSRLAGIAHGADLWVAVGDAGKILSSPDGITWVARDSGVTVALYGATYASGQFVAVGAAGQILTSENGTTWTQQTSGVTQALRAISVVKGRFVAAGDSGRLLVSTDGTTWAPATMEGRTNSMRAVAGDGDEGLLLGLAGEYYGCVDPSTWTRRTRGRPEATRAVAYADGRFVAVTEGYDSAGARWMSPIIVSSDGLGWTPWAAGATSSAQLYGISFGRQTWVASGTSGRIYTSGDASTWTQRTSGVTSTLYATASSPTAHIAVGASGRIVGSADAAAWSARDSGVTVALRGAAWGGRGFVVVGDSGTILNSADGGAWAVQTSGTTANLNAVIWSEGIGYVAAGNSGTLLVSSDGTTWTARTANTADPIYALANTPLGIVAGSSTTGVMLFSSDAVTWIKGTVPTDRSIRGVAASATEVIAVGDNGAMLSNRLRNMPPTIAVQPESKAVIRGDSGLLTVEVRNATGALYQWFRDGVAVAGATRSAYTIDAASDATAGTYTVRVSTGAGSVTSAPATVVVVAAGTAPGRLVNLSILSALTSASDSFTVGVVVGGTGTVGSKPLLVRAAGPSLSTLGVSGVLEDPRLELYSGSTKAAENDNWGGTEKIRTVAAQVGAFPFAAANSRDAAIDLPYLTTGAHSARVTGTGAGLVIAELYDATPAASFTSATPRLINVSVLKHLGSGVTAGFVISGSTARTVLIRAVGPTLGAPPFELGDVVADPQLSLFSGQTRLNSNDDWGGTAALTEAFSRVGAFALGPTSKDAALLMELPPGSYTVQVAGGAGTGVALIEIYEVP